ncbi:UNVERIFIED_CONTAM: Selenocysteine methyltransferase [Sesamum calycinum]|uniref:Selenocysteine methyltransferase n=1 Tax=Sesamum calycinum TaxID=2727403 RepID=A0AAW2SAD2_9LAMI
MDHLKTISIPSVPDGEQVHLDYLEAGADIIITASYQSVECKHCEARELYYRRCREASTGHTSDNRVLKQRQILVAASVGSYGAYLADGSEFQNGDYGDAMDLGFLKNFHRRRAFAQLSRKKKLIFPAWAVFKTQRMESTWVSGDALPECVAVAESSNKIVAVGINCTPPRFIRDLILSIKKVTSKPILIYPNSGESYDADRKEWVQNTGVSDEDFVSYVNKWCEAGASLVGGCCRTTPNTIRAIYRTLSRNLLPLPKAQCQAVQEERRS